MCSDVSTGDAFGLEFIVTFIVVFAFFSLLDPKLRFAGSSHLSTMHFGAVVTLVHLIAVSQPYHALRASRRGTQIVPWLWLFSWHKIKESSLLCFILVTAKLPDSIHGLLHQSCSLFWPRCGYGCLDQPMGKPKSCRKPDQLSTPRLVQCTVTS